MGGGGEEIGHIPKNRKQKRKEKERNTAREKSRKKKSRAQNVEQAMNSLKSLKANENNSC